MEKKKRSILSFIGGQQDSRREYKNIDIEEFSVTQQIISVPIKDILANPEQPRKIFYDEAIKELSGSIKEYGVLQPIILKKESDGYIIIAGERRFRAAQMAGLSEIPALVKNMEDQEAALVSLVENVQREDLNFL
ncbi:MAG: ParB/RepB/Spo0J family partition protein, partial [Anaerovoracaceae bacterium]|nr:ParB/RepB/Spo0J family partition protein [Anaerovoracaceae bacterium]